MQSLEASYPTVRRSREGSPGTVAFAATVGNMVGITPAISATFGVFLVPLSTEFQWSRALVSGVLGLVSVVSALVYPLVGRAMDRFGPRRLLIAGNIGFGLSVAGVALTNGNVLHFYLMFALIGLMGSIPSTAMFCKVVSNWFNEQRGLMLGVTAGVGNAVGATFMPIIAGLLLTSVGWRGAFLGIGAIVVAVGAPILLLFLYDAKGRTDAVVEDPELVTGLSLKEAARTRTFWLLLLGVAAGAGGMTAVFTHVVPMLTDHGVSLTEATTVIALFALVTAVWQVGTGFLLDRFRSPRLITPMYAIAIGGLAILQFGHGSALMLLAGAMLGVGLGAEFAALPYFISRYFGLRCYGAITGALYAVVILVQGLTPAMMDLSFDHSGSYDRATIATICALAFGMMIFALLPKPKL